MAIGPAVGGWLAMTDYRLLFWVDGLTCVAAAGFALFRLPTPRKVPHEPSEGTDRGQARRIAPFFILSTLGVED